MKVSVILPIYNGEKTLEETIKSLKDQTYQDFELVACIDGTEDGSEDILELYREHFPRLTILKNEKNLGLGPTMNRLVAHTSGEYIAVAEQDDYYYPDRLQLQVALLDSEEEVGLVSGIAEFWNGEKVTSKFPGILVHGGQYPQGKELFLLNYIKQTKIVNSCMMFRKSVHQNYGLYFSQHYPNIPIDWAYFLRFSLDSKVHGLGDVLVRLDRRANRNSLTKKVTIHNEAKMELLRCFYYEYPEIINKDIYEKALVIQRELELSSRYGSTFYSSLFLYLIRNPFQSMPYILLTKRINQKLTKIKSAYE
ncbi:glycosyltransferase family 2 protein [Aequorivita marina]|uniref:glycosyltransferase family 2 protein n=1 Tax=Aequorivita marina TaxID=3073654 RepID=UPI002875A8C7|nr:glycosyltransferase family 2 protein [Aequorivita sp. S2608]MDS1298045.1 glycosyltransferase family 2 protein [Aequorivita sp. S2608]